MDDMIEDLKVIPARIEEEHKLFEKSSIYFSLENSNPVCYTEKPFIYHAIVQYPQFQHPHLDRNNTFIKLGVRYCYERKSNVNYDNFLRTDWLEKQGHCLVMRTSDGMTHQLPLDTPFYVTFSKTYQSLNKCINQLIEQQRLISEEMLNEG